MRCQRRVQAKKMWCTWRDSTPPLVQKTGALALDDGGVEAGAIPMPGTQTYTLAQAQFRRLSRPERFVAGDR